MKKKLLIFGLTILTGVTFGQTQPTVHNATFNKIAKSSGTDCACSGWINKDLADQGESSTKDSQDVVKLDDLESDGVYQEVAVVANSNYTLDLEYWYNTSLATTTQHIEVIVLKGSAYVQNYTPAYAAPATAAQDGFGYETIAEVENTANHIARTLITPPGNTDKNSMTQLSFSTGSETSIALFIRSVGPYNAAIHGDSSKDKGWMNGDAETRIDNLVLTNLGATASVGTNFLDNLKVYPNPTNGIVKISSSENIKSLAVFNTIGKKVLSVNSVKNNTVDVSSLTSGLYFVKLTDGINTATKRLIKN